MIEAEEYGITSSNASSLKIQGNPHKRLVGSGCELGALGLEITNGAGELSSKLKHGESYKKHIVILH